MLLHLNKTLSLALISIILCIPATICKYSFFELHICFGMNNVKFSLYGLGRRDYVFPIQNSFMYPTIPKMVKHKNEMFLVTTN